MMRPRTPSLLGAAALSLLALTTTAAAPAWAGDGPATTSDGGKTVLKLVETETGGQYVPKGGQPQDFPEDEEFAPDPGDAFTFTGDLSQGGSKVGTNSGRCTVIDVEAFIERCVVTFTFANGSFTAADTIDFPNTEGPPPPFTAAIVSGTGAFAGASGTLTVAEQEESANLTAVFTTTGQVAQVPSGGAAAGGGLAGSSTPSGLIALGGLVGLAGVGVLVGGRRLASGRSS